MKFIILFCFSITLLLVSSSFAQEVSDAVLGESSNQVNSPITKVFEPKGEARALSLKEVLEEGLRKNPDERVRDFDRQLLQLNWEDTYQSFWYPQLSLRLGTNQDQRIGRFYSGDGGDNSPTTSSPSGFFGLEFQDYTIFNWGKDYLTYLNSRQDYLRSRRRLDEERRDLKHDLIQRYFNLVTDKRKVELYGDYFRQTSFVYRFVRERAAQKKTSSAAYYRARTNYLAAQKKYQESLVQNELADERFALFLGDDLGTNYRQKDRLRFIPMRLPLLDAIQLSLANAPQLLTAKKDLENAQRSYQLALKENLPLPKFSVKLGGYTSSFSKDGQTTRYETYPDSKSIELVATLNAEWTLWGENGFMNGRRTTRSLVERQKQEREFYDTKRDIESEIRALYRQLQSLEGQIEVLKSAQSSANKNVETHLDAFTKDRIPLLEVHQALEHQLQLEIELEEAYYSHLQSKIALAKLIGVEDFPGENFENLAVSNL